MNVSPINLVLQNIFIVPQHCYVYARLIFMDFELIAFIEAIQTLNDESKENYKPEAQVFIHWHTLRTPSLPLFSSHSCDWRWVELLLGIEIGS